MIHLAPIRAELAACTGDRIVLSVAQVEQLLDEAETGQVAKRELRRRDAGIERVSTPYR